MKEDMQDFNARVRQSNLETAERREQWKKSKGYQEAKGSRCIMRLVGKRCMSGYDHYRLKEEHHCAPPHADHMYLWRDKRGELVYTSQPYAFSWDYLQETIDFCRKHGLRVDIDFPDRAWWNPGGVLMLEFRKAGPRQYDPLG